MAELLSSELDAVNWLLSIIGEAPVNSLEDTGLIDVAAAQNDLRDIKRQVLMKGWHFNTEDDFTLPLDVNGEVVCGDDWLAVSTTLADGRDVVKRNGKLYDRVDHTTVFTKALQVRLVYNLPWGDLPEYARNYIKVLAGEKFQKNRVGSSTLMQLNAEDVTRARIDFLREDAKYKKVNLYYQNPTVALKQDRSSDYAMIGNRVVR